MGGDRNRRSTRWAKLMGLVAWVALACSASGTSAPSPGVHGYDEGRLQLLVHDGLRTMGSGPCRAPLLLGVLDSDEAGAELDRMLERATSARADDACSEILAAARIVRLGRSGAIDLEAEMAHPLPIVRAVAIRYSLGTQSPAVSRRVVLLGMADADADVRIVAYRAAAALGDPELATALGNRSAEDETEEFWRCTALSRMQSSVQCPEPSVARAVLPPGQGEPEDLCMRAREELGAQDRTEGLWFFLTSAFRQRVEPLDRIELSQREVTPCVLDEATEDELLSSSATSSEERALVAAGLLWRRHEPVGMVRAKRVQLRDVALNDSIRFCSSASDCPSDTGCFRSPGGGRQGICGTPDTSPRGSGVRVHVTVGSNACWSFLDCPAFYSCYYPNPYASYGVCVR